ncbi:MAG: MaoC family dehydratase [Burkholderiales bacterium]|nr:MaoC family dehydratase [Burkholderiales bacterium]
MTLPARPFVAPLVLYFEDYPPGRVFELGDIDVDPIEVQAFAQRFDPQPFHIDAAAAAQSPYGGIIASGWHTASLAMRLLTETFLSPDSSLGSPGIDELRWLLPVRPGDRLSGRASILSAKRSQSRPDRGIAITQIELRNQREEAVLTMKAVNMLRCRPS